MNILFITPYPSGFAPSQRFRFEQYINSLKNNNSKITYAPFLSKKSWLNLYKNGNSNRKVTTVFIGFLKRFILLLKVFKYDFIFIHREATPIGPPWFEFIVANLLRRKIIYDFDDAIWLQDPDETGTFLASLKWKQKVASICRWSYKISAGNEYLAEYAGQFNKNVIIIPTTIDTEHHHNPELHPLKKNHKVIIGWTGTHSTLQYLNPLVPVLKELEISHHFEFLVIANKNPKFPLKSFRFIPWRKETEIEDLMKIDIGLMPLTNDEWSKGKCGFKLLQYMALEIASIASPIGVNKIIIDDGENGSIASTPEEFADKIRILLKDQSLRESMGKKGRKNVEDKYSVHANEDIFLSLFE